MIGKSTHAMTVDSAWRWRLAPSPPYSGERVGVRGLGGRAINATCELPHPSPPTPLPEYRERGVNSPAVVGFALPSTWAGTAINAPRLYMTRAPSRDGRPRRPTPVHLPRYAQRS